MRLNFEVRSIYPPACLCESTLNARVAFSSEGHLLGRFCGFLRIVAGYAFGLNT